MFERFTDRARRVVVLAQEEARLLRHNYIGTEHILLGLTGEGEGVGAKVLQSLGVSPDAIRQQVQQVARPGKRPPSGHIPFTPGAKKVFELALREMQELGHNYIGTEHILLGLAREGKGVAAQVLTTLGVDLPGLRARVMQLSGSGGDPAIPDADPQREMKYRAPSEALPRLDALESRLSAVEQLLAHRSDTHDVDKQLDEVRREKETAIGAAEFERAASLRDREKQLLGELAARQQGGQAGNPSLPALAETCRRLTDEVEQIRVLLRQHGIDPDGKTA